MISTSSFPTQKGVGKGSFVYELARRMTTEFDVFVLTPYLEGAKEQEIWDGVHITRYKFLPWSKHSIFSHDGMLPSLQQHKLYWLSIPFLLYSQLLHLQRLLKQEGITLIHAHWLIPQGAIAVIYKLLFNRRIKIVTTIHGGDIFSFQRKVFIPLKKFILDRIDRVTVVSKAIEKEIRKLGYQKDVYIYPMGVDTRMFHPTRHNQQFLATFGKKDQYLLFVGRLTEKKGVSYLIEAMPEVIKQCPNTILLIAGYGVLEQRLIELVQQLKIEKYVVFLGKVPHHELPTLFASADIFIGPSILATHGDREGFGLVFAEAMSCGTLVITTDLAAMEDIISDNETGFIVKQKDSKELAYKICYVCNHAAELNDIRFKAREHITRNFEWEMIANKYIKLLSETLQA